MATLREAINIARTEPDSQRSQMLMAAIHSGKMDDVASKEGIDLSKFKEATSHINPNTSKPNVSGSEVAGNIAKTLIKGVNPANWGKMAEDAAISSAPVAGKAVAAYQEAVPTKVTDEQLKIREAENKKKTDEMIQTTQQMNKLGAVPKSDMSMEDRSKFLGEVEKVQPGANLSANIATDAEAGLSQGAGKVYGAGQKLGYAITGVDENGQELSADQRAQKFGESLIDTASGSLEGLFAVPGAVVGQVPGVKQVVGFGMDKLKEGSDAIANKYIEIAGLDPEGDQAKYLRDGMNTLAQLLVTKATEDTGKELGRQKGMTKAQAAGDIAAYETLASQKPTMTGNFGANVVQGAEALAAPILDSAKNVAQTGVNVGKQGVETVQKVFTQTPEKINASMDKVIDRGIDKGVKPSISGKKSSAQREQFKTQSRDAVKIIVNNKENLRLSTAEGEILNGELPKNLKQFAEAVEQTKGKIFKEYDLLTKEAGGKGAKVETTPIAEELMKVANDEVLKDTNPGVAQYAKQKADIYKKRGAYTPSQAQEAIKAYNDSLNAFYRNPSYDNFAKANVDALIVNRLRASLDETVSGLTGKEYQSLKNQYASLKAIEKDVNHRAIVDARKNKIGIGENFANLMSASEAVHGILSMNPASLASSVGIKGVMAYIKHINDPNVIVKNMFNKVGKKAEKLKKISP